MPYNSATGRDFEPAAAPSRAGLSMASTGKLVLIQCAVLLNCCETHKHAVFQIVGVEDMPFSCAGVLVCSCSSKSGLECGSVEEDTDSHGRLRSSQRRHLLELLPFSRVPFMNASTSLFFLLWCPRLGDPMPIPTRNLGAGSEPLGGSPWKAGTQRQMLEWIPCAGAAEVIWSSKLKVRRHGPVAVDMLAANCRWVKSKHMQRAPIFLHFLLVHQGVAPLREFHL